MIKAFPRALLLVATLSLTLGMLSPLTAKAADPGNLISDSAFINQASMSEAQINNFINSFPNSCLIPRNYPADISPISFLEPTNYFNYGGKVSAARVIYNSANLFHINPQVILATLEKEQNLVTGNAGCASWHYNSAMGYNCPDNLTYHDYASIGIYHTCVERESNAGFSRQVNHASWQLSFDMHRAYGDTSWGGDGSIYYGGRMTQGTRARVEGGAQAYYDGYTSIDSQAVYLANGATAALYNYTPHFNNFQRIFTQWFGDTVGPVAYKTASSSTIYTTIYGYKMAVPYMAVLNDYGISSDSVSVVDQSFIDSIPSPGSTNGLSSEIAHVVKSPSDSDEDGGSVYVIAVGKRYQFQSMQQFYNFGFKESDVRYLPLQYILNKPSGGMLPNHISSPLGSVFEVSSPQKQLIFEYQTFAARSNQSGYAPMFSYYLIDKIPSGNPIVDHPVLIKPANAEWVNLYTGTNYYSIPDYETLKCWGFETNPRTPIYRLPNNSYAANANPSSGLNCLQSQGGTNYLLVGGYRDTVPNQMSPTTQIQPVPADVSGLFLSLPISHTLSPYVITPGDAAVWVLSNGTRRVIPTYGTYQSIGLSAANLDTIPLSLLNGYVYDGIHLNPGQLVKDSDSAAVFSVDKSGRYAYATSDLFLAYGNKWGAIDTISTNNLNTNYPAKGVVSPVLLDRASSQGYLVAENGCYNITDILPAYGTSIDKLKTTQPYDSTIFKSLPQLSTCPKGTPFVKSPNSSLVYQLSGGTKYPITTYSKFIALGASTTPPVVMTLGSGFISQFPTGNPL